MSTLLHEGVELEKPWTKARDPRRRYSYFLSLAAIFFWGALALAYCYFGAKSLNLIGNTCMFVEDDFSSGIDPSLWAHEVVLGGFK